MKRLAAISIVAALVLLPHFAMATYYNITITEHDLSPMTYTLQDIPAIIFSAAPEMFTAKFTLPEIRVDLYGTPVPTGSLLFAIYESSALASVSDIVTMTWTNSTNSSDWEITVVSDTAGTALQLPGTPDYFWWEPPWGTNKEIAGGSLFLSGSSELGWEVRDMSSPDVVPLPPSVLLLGAGLIPLAWFRRKKRGGA